MLLIKDIIPGNFSPGPECSSPLNEADWIDRRVRTMSSGYVSETEVMPAVAPQKSLCTGLSAWPGLLSKNYHHASDQPMQK